MPTSSTADPNASADAGDSRPIGVLLVNLGSPAEPTTPAVRRYLRQFLSDPRVLDLPGPVRRTVLETAILPVRSRRSAELYASIWSQEHGSPLVHHTKELADAVGSSLGQGWVVEAAMRYGEPSIATAWDALRAAGVRRIVVVPLYPQETSSTIGSVIAEVHARSDRDWVPTPVSVVPAFYRDPGFLASWREVAAPALEAARADHVLFSFHSIPQRHITKADPTAAHCLTDDACCDATGSSVAAGCYRAQCAATAKSLASDLELPDGRWSFSFQSRLGRIPWVQPYTDLEYQRLYDRGVRRLAVMCPAFVADNLETLEEIGIRGARQWRELGGEELILVPSLNAHPRWVQAVVALVRAQAGSDADAQVLGFH